MKNIIIFTLAFTRHIGIMVAVLAVVELIAKADEARSAKKLRKQFSDKTLKRSDEYEAGVLERTRYVHKH